MIAPATTTAPLTPFEYELLAERDTVAGYAAWNDGDYHLATSRWISAARWEQHARNAYTCQTGLYTVDQLEGEDCARCGRPFAVAVADASRPAERVGDAQLFVHVSCPKGGA